MFENILNFPTKNQTSVLTSSWIPSSGDSRLLLLTTAPLGGCELDTFLLILAYILEDPPGPPPGAPVELDEPVGVGVEELVSKVGELFWIGSKLLLVRPPERKTNVCFNGFYVYYQICT